MKQTTLYTDRTCAITLTNEENIYSLELEGDGVQMTSDGESMFVNSASMSAQEVISMACAMLNAVADDMRPQDLQDIGYDEAKATVVAAMSAVHAYNEHQSGDNRTSMSFRTGLLAGLLLRLTANK